MRRATAWITMAVLVAGLLAASLGAQFFQRALDSTRLELGERRIQTLDPSLIELIRTAEAPLSAMLFITSEAKAPSNRRGLEADLTGLLADLKAALPSRFTFGVADPTDDEDMQRFAAKHKVTPFRAVATRGDQGQAHELFATLLLDWGPLGSARLEHLGPEHLGVLQTLIKARLNELLEPTRPRFALLAPAQSEDSGLSDLLVTHGEVQRFDPEAKGFDWEDLYDADLIFWLRPGKSAQRALPEIERLVDSGRAVIVAGSPFAEGASLGIRALLSGLGLTMDTDPLASSLVDSIAPDQDFRLLSGQPNGTLFFENPAALNFDPIVLARRKTNARFLATSRERRTNSDANIPAGPKRGLIALLDPTDARRGRIVALASSTPFENFGPGPGSGAHRALVNVLVRSFTNPDRRTLLTALPHPPRAVPELSSSSRFFMRALVSLCFPLLAALLIYRPRRGLTPKRKRPARSTLRSTGLPLTMAFALALVLATAGEKLPAVTLDLTQDQLSEPSPVTLEVASDLASRQASLKLEILVSPASKLPGDLSQLVPRTLALVKALESTGLKVELSRSFPESLDRSSREDLERTGVLPFNFTGPVGLGGEEARSAWASLRLRLADAKPLVLSFEGGAELEELDFRLTLALEKLRLGKTPKLGFASDLPRLSAAESYEFQTKRNFAPREGDVFGRARRALGRSGFDVVHINPRANDEELAALVNQGDLDALLWLQPRREVRPMLAAFARFLTDGGRAMIAAQQYRTQARRYRGAGYETVFWPQPQSIDVDRFWLPELGVSLVPKVRFDQLDASMPLASRLNGKSADTEFEPLVTRAPFLVRIPNAQFTSDPLLRGVSDLFTPDPTAIELDLKRLQDLDLTARPLIFGSAHSWSLDWKGGWLPDELLDANLAGRDFEAAPLFGVALSGRFPAPKAAWGDRPEDLFADESSAAELFLLGNSALFTDEIFDRGGGGALLLNMAAELALWDFGPRGAALARLAGRRPVDRGIGIIPKPDRRRAKVLVIGGATVILLILIALRRLAMWWHQPKGRLDKPLRPKGIGPLPWRPVLASILIGSLAYGGLNSLATSQAKRQAGTLVFGRVVPPEVREKTIAALTLKAPLALSGAEAGLWTYVHQAQADGGGALWRELRGAGALGDGQAILALIEDLLEAEGQVVANDAAGAEALGFLPESSWQIELFPGEATGEGSDPDQDPLERLGSAFLTAELGRASADGSSVMLRIAGNPAVWSIDRNPRYRLEETLNEDDAKQRLAAAPPLADRSLVPNSWPGRTVGLGAVAWQRQGEKSLRLIETPMERTPEEMQAGLRPTAWRLLGKGTDEIFESAPLLGGPLPPSMSQIATQQNNPADVFLRFIARSKYTELLSPDLISEYGLGPGKKPTAILLYSSRPSETAPEGYSFSISIGPELSPAQGGGHAAIHSATRNLIRLSKDFVDTALARPEDFRSQAALRQWKVK